MGGLKSTIKKEHDGWWHEFLEELPAGKARALRKSMMRVDSAGNPSLRPEAAEDPEQYAWDLIKVAVVSWSFDAPITDEGIAGLPDRVVNQIAQDINTQYKPATKKEQDEQKKG